jgi:hypothetical protein
MATTTEEGVRQIEELVRRLEQIPDPASRETARSLIEAVLELHGAGLQRIMEVLFEAGDSGQAAIRHLAADPLVSSLLVLHDLHPDSLETRVRRALAKMHGAAEVIGVFEGSVRVRLLSTSCGLKESVESAIREEVPDVLEIVIYESVSSPHDFVPLASLGLPLGLPMTPQAAEHA